MPDRPLHRRIASHIRGQAVGYLAIFLALGGGYALAATNTKTINACIIKKTGELIAKSRCSRGQSKITWNQQGPQGIQGKTGLTGPPGPTPPSAWAFVSNNGVADPSDGLTATHTSAGTYQITVTAPACAGGEQNAPVVTLSDSNPPGGELAGAFPVAWIGVAGTAPTFTVYTGDVVSGTFTASDHSFSLQDVCGTR